MAVWRMKNENQAPKTIGVWSMLSGDKLRVSQAETPDAESEEFGLMFPAQDPSSSNRRNYESVSHRAHFSAWQPQHEV